MVYTEPRIIFGGGAFISRSAFDPDGKISKFLDVLEELKIGSIDTAVSYGDSEALLGESDAASRFNIDTKYSASIAPTPSSKDGIIKTGTESLKKLNTKSVDVYYLHAPDDRAPLEKLLEGINELYKSGAFKRFGLSNFTAEDVERVVGISKQQNYVIPSVYQGNYNAFARRTETELLPVLRKHSIVFYAYSPSAGGFLTKTSEQLRNGGTGRWNPESPSGKIYGSLYKKPTLLAALDEWNQIAEDEGISNVELSYRWITHNSKLQGGLGDAVIIGSLNLTHLRDTVAAIKNGPLSAEVSKKVDEIWDKIAPEAPLDNYNSFIINNRGPA